MTGLDLQVGGLVLLAAAFHAVWNVIVKRSDDPLQAQWLVIGTGALLCLPLLPFVEPPARASWPYLVAGIALHNGYYAFLVQSYRAGDLSRVYPLARGSAPLLVVAGSAVFASESLPPGGLVGVVAISLGIGMLALNGRGTAAGAPSAVIASAWAVGTGVWIAGYSLVDGLGIRETPQAISFIAWLVVGCAVPITLWVALRRRGRITPYLRANWRSGIASGVISVIAYAIVMWCYQRAPLGAVSALRETSVVFGALFGWWILREAFGPVRIIATLLVAAGVAALHLSR